MFFIYLGIQQIKNQWVKSKKITILINSLLKTMDFLTFIRWSVVVIFNSINSKKCPGLFCSMRLKILNNTHWLLFSFYKTKQQRNLHIFRYLRSQYSKLWNRKNVTIPLLKLIYICQMGILCLYFCTEKAIKFSEMGGGANLSDKKKSS